MWRCLGLRWGEDGPALAWERAHAAAQPAARAPGGAGAARSSPLAYGAELAFRAAGPRTCVGFRRYPCPVAAPVPGRATDARCPECARLDRAHSVAADTALEDRRPYRVYLAWFGPGLVKAGITAEARGAARLREQGAVAFTWLAVGPLMAARRAEETLRVALGVPDRVPYAVKRGARALPPDIAEGAEALGGLHARAVALESWPEALRRLPFEAVDHAEVFGLAAAGAGAAARGLDVVAELVDGGWVAGRLVAAAGPDLHLAAPDGGPDTVLDSRLMRGWLLTGRDGADTGDRPGGEPGCRDEGAPPAIRTDVPVRSLPAASPAVQEGLF